MDTALWLCPSLPTETLKWLSSLPILMQKSFWSQWWQCSDRYIISFSTHLHTPFPPFSPSLISRTVSVDVKHHVYLLWFLSKVPGEIKRSRDLRGGRWSWIFKFAQKRSWVGRWSWAEQVGPLLLRVVQVVHQQQCNGHCLCDSVQAQQLKQQLRSAQVAGQWRGDAALTLLLSWRRSTVSPVFFGRFPRSSLHSLCPRP